MIKTNANGNPYVKACILDALLALMDETPFQDITVSDITRRAKVSRMAYYRNYTSREEILTGQLESIVGQYALFSQLSPGIEHHITPKNIAGVFERCAEQEKFILKCDDAGLGYYILDTITGYLLTYFVNDRHETMREYILYAYASALYATVVKWLRSGMGEPVAEMADMLYRVFGAHV